MREKCILIGNGSSVLGFPVSKYNIEEYDLIGVNTYDTFVDIFGRVNDKCISGNSKKCRRFINYVKRKGFKIEIIKGSDIVNVLNTKIDRVLFKGQLGIMYGILNYKEVIITGNDFNFEVPRYDGTFMSVNKRLSDSMIYKSFENLKEWCSELKGSEYWSKIILEQPNNEILSKEEMGEGLCDNKGMRECKRKHIIIGNSNKLIENEVRIGSKIDEFDIVYRFNNAKISDKFSVYVGKKITYRVIHPGIYKKLLRRRKKLSCNMLLSNADNYFDENEFDVFIPYIFLEGKRKEYMYEGKNISTGLGVILYLLDTLDLNNEELWISNFDYCESGKVHYFNNEVASKSHDWAHEKIIMDGLIKENRIKVLENMIKEYIGDGE